MENSKNIRSHASRGNAVPTARRDYHYDAAGNRDEISINGRTPSIYEYTRLNRLKNADHPAVEESWFHDEYYVDDWEGNLIASHNNVSQKGFNALHQLVLDETYAYTYDLDGNLKTRTLRSDPAQVTNYHFNAANQLVKVVAADGSSVEFGYDVAGRRARKTNRGAGGQLLNDRYYSYNGADLETEYYGNGAKHLNYLYGPGIDNVLAVNAANSNYYFLKDAQNSVLAITNYQKTVLKRYWYDSYGNIVYESGALPFENTVTYTGREWDAEIGMYYLRARYYDPRPARFISEDPIWQTNLYMYVNNNPLMYVDPWGLEAGMSGGGGFGKIPPPVSGPYIPPSNNEFDAFDMLNEFVHGLGPQTRILGPDSKYASHMKYSHDMDKARKYFYSKNKFKGDPRNYEELTDYGAKFNFPWDLIRAGVDQYQQSIGSYDVNMWPINDGAEIMVFITNETSMESAFYRQAKSHAREESLECGTIKQVIWWTEPLESPLLNKGIYKFQNTWDRIWKKNTENFLEDKSTIYRHGDG